MQTGPAGDGRVIWLGGAGRDRLRRSDAADDLLSLPVEQRQRARHDATYPVDVCQAWTEDLCVVVDVADEVRGLLQVRRDPVEQAAYPEEIESQPAGEHANGEDGQDHQAPHHLTFASTLPRKR